MILKTIKNKIIFRFLTLIIFFGALSALIIIKFSYLPFIQFLFEYSNKNTYNALIVFFSTIAITSIGTTIFILSTGYKLLKPIRLIREMIENIGQGNFENINNPNQGNEFEELSNIISNIAKKFKNERQDLKSEIDKRIVEINKQNLKAVNTNKAILNILEDIEQEKDKAASLAKSLEKFKLALDNTVEYVIITNAEGEIVYANKGVENVINYKINQLLGKKIEELWGALMTNEQIKEVWQSLRVDKKPFITEINTLHLNGLPHSYYLAISPVLNDKKELEFLVNITRDITREKEIDRAKTEFVSLASHQLRTPLSSVSWYAEMLIANDVGKLNKKQAEFIQEIYESNKRMIDLVNSLLSVSRLELGTFAINPEPINIPESAASVLEELKPSITSKKLNINFSVDKNWPLVEADPKYIRIIFQNILSNAVKYTPDKGKISLTLEKDDDKLSIKVADNGYGIPASQTGKIFDKLFRADNIRQKDTEGTGLGLYLVKSIVDNCGGKIWFESTENKGTTFFIELPFQGLKAKTKK